MNDDQPPDDTDATLDAFIASVDYDVAPWQREVLKAVMDGDYRPAIHLNRRGDRARMARAAGDLADYLADAER